MKSSIFIALLIISSSFLFAQRGKDGTGTFTISTANTIVNQYTSLTSNAISTSTLSVASSTAFSVGDLVFIIQMQGASVNAGRDTLFPDVNSSIPTNSSYGAITLYNASGNYEFAQVNSVPNSTSIVLDCQLTHSYVATGKVQVIRVPRYNNLLINSPGTITSPLWNGTTGGVVVVEVAGNLTMNSVGSFSVVGRGFRGGAAITNTLSYTGGGNKYGSLLRQEGAYKGESIAGDTTRYKVYSSVYGRGAIANGGGGGCTHNAGGGGGANGGNTGTYSGFGNPAAGYNTAWAVDGVITGTHTSSGGGRGGYTYSNSNQAVTLAPGNASWIGDSRRNVGGLGGRPLDYSLGKLFLGGGGGAGHGNDSRAGAGGNGGGMVFIQCYGNLSGSGTIFADGANGNNTNTNCSTNDGAGGGGGGGTIILNVGGTTNLTAATALSARGGNGGNVSFSCAFANTASYGPGAGGGGGYIASNNALPLFSVSGGANGIHTGNANNIGNNFPPNGATAGGAGNTGTIAIYTITASANQTLCANQAFTVSASTNRPGAGINWYNALVGGNAISTGNTFSSPGYSVNGTYTLYAGYCNQGTYRVPVVLIVNTGLNISVNTASICPGQTATLTANPSSAISYTWDSGANTNSIVVSPTVTTSYTVNGLSGTCSGVQTTTVFISAQPTVSVSDATICAGSSASLSASGATSYTWNPGSLTTQSVVLTPTTSTIYTVTGSNGGCIDTKTLQVIVAPSPSLSVGSVTVCAGQTATLTAFGANSFTWQPGSVAGSSYTIAPVSNTTVQVVGAIGTCSAQVTASVTIGTNVSIAVNNPTICAGETTTITASGANTYTWSNGSNNSSITVTPSTTSVYTINGTAGSCNGSNTSTVTVYSVPTLTATSSSICSGETASISVSGASTYTWSNGNQTYAQTLTPSSTESYTVTGTSVEGCISLPVTSNITVNFTPTLTVNSPSICSGQSATLTANGAFTYTWSTLQNGNSIVVNPPVNSTYSVVGANGNCFSSIDVNVLVSQTPTIAAISASPGGCAPVCVSFVNTPTNSDELLSYNFGDGNLSSLNNPVHCFSVSGTYSANVTVTNSVSGCFSVYPITGPITIENTPIADFSFSNTDGIIVGDVIETTNNSSNSTSYDWLICSSQTSTLNTVSIATQDTGTCCVRLIARNINCVDTVIKCIKIDDNPKIEIPNVFTPNNDGNNDVFIIKGRNIKTFSCIIYDRWGLKIIELTSINTGWDGKHANGNIATDGTYFYIINYTDSKGVSKTEKGFLSLFRE
jgi:gliding motility-associated-like protein